MSDDVNPKPHRDGSIQLRLPAGLARVGVTSRMLAATGAGLLAVVVATATVTLASSDGDARQRPAAQRVEDDSYSTPVGDLLGSGDYPLPALSGDTGQQGVPAGTAPRPTVPAAPGQAAQDAGEISTYRGGAGTLTPAGIATLAIGAGCSADSAVTATAVAIAESGGSPSAQGDTTLMDATWDWSAGLWQIRGLKAQRNTGSLRDSVANHDARTNAKAMYAISSGCANWGPWTTYTRGTYESFLAIARRAVAYVEAYRRSHGGALPPVAAPDPDAPIPAGAGAPGAAAGTGAAPARTAPASAPRSTAPGTRANTAAPAPSGSSAPKAATTAPTTTSTTVPTKLPSKLPTLLPTKLPTLLPTKLPTLLPTKLPTLLPTTLPRLLP